jgi:hypothetical protein
MNLQFFSFNGSVSTFSKALCCILVMRMKEVGKTVKGKFRDVFLRKFRQHKVEMKKGVDGNRFGRARV